GRDQALARLQVSWVLSEDRPKVRFSTARLPSLQPPVTFLEQLRSAASQDARTRPVLRVTDRREQHQREYAKHPAECQQDRLWPRLAGHVVPLHLSVFHVLQRAGEFVPFNGQVPVQSAPTPSAVEPRNRDIGETSKTHTMEQGAGSLQKHTRGQISTRPRPPSR